MIDYFKSYEFISMLALFTYWIPASVCLSVYFFRSIKLYKSDLKKCNDEHYRPDLTIGLLVWMLICSVIPAVNLLALVFDCAGSVFKWLGQVLDIPLVRKQRSN